jgi:hypothetical protein
VRPARRRRSVRPDAEDVVDDGGHCGLDAAPVCVGVRSSMTLDDPGTAGPAISGTGSCPGQTLSQPADKQRLIDATTIGRVSSPCGAPAGHVLTGFVLLPGPQCLPGPTNSDGSPLFGPKPHDRRRPPEVRDGRR